MARGTAANGQWAFVLHQYPWSESSLILDLFTRQQGRVTVVAKGARRASSQMRSVLLPFQRILVHLGRSARDRLPAKAHSVSEDPSDLLPLRGAEWAAGENQAMMEGAALFSGFYLNELLMRLLPREEPAPRLFDLYTLTLPALMSGVETHAQAALRAFEWGLLKELGHLPDLQRTTTTQEPLDGAELYALTAELGLVPARYGEGLAGRQWLALQEAMDQEDLPALQRACVPALSEFKSMLRRVLQYHLGTRPLRTREILQDIVALQVRV